MIVKAPAWVLLFRDVLAVACKPDRQPKLKLGSLADEFDELRHSSDIAKFWDAGAGEVLIAGQYGIVQCNPDRRSAVPVNVMFDPR